MSTIAEPRQFRQLDAQIKAVWRRGQVLHFVAGTLALFRWVVPLFLVGVAVDWITDMPVAGRFAILFLLLAVSLYKACSVVGGNCACSTRHGLRCSSRITMVDLIVC